MVDLDGKMRCNRSDQRGVVPHHLSPIFWRFWNRTRLAALLEMMRNDENLQWLGHRLVCLRALDGSERYLR